MRIITALFMAVIGCSASADLDAPEPLAGRGEVVCSPAPPYPADGQPCSPSVGCPPPDTRCMVAVCSLIDGRCHQTPYVAGAMACGVGERCVLGECCHDQ